MYLRYRTYDPLSVWYDDVDVVLPYDVNQAKETLKKQCRNYFGAQYLRYDMITISLVSGADSVIEVDLKPAKEPFIPFDHDPDNGPIAA